MKLVKEEILNGRVEVYHDVVAEKLDEMADICEYWKKNRDKGRNPGAIRAALLMIAEEVRLLSEPDKVVMQSIISKFNK